MSNGATNLVTRHALLAALLFSPLAAATAVGDYCLGEWSDSHDEFCTRFQIAATGYAMDWVTGASIETALATVPLAAEAHALPKDLLRHVINTTWEMPQSPEHFQMSPAILGEIWFSWCVDYVEIVTSPGASP
jgi:hypothetical protein